MYNRRMPTTTLRGDPKEYETEEGVEETTQFTTTVPAGLVQAMDWEAGDRIEWKVVSGNKLSVKGAE